MTPYIRRLLVATCFTFALSPRPVKAQSPPTATNDRAADVKIAERTETPKLDAPSWLMVSDVETGPELDAFIEGLDEREARVIWLVTGCRLLFGEPELQQKMVERLKAGDQLAVHGFFFARGGQKTPILEAGVRKIDWNKLHPADVELEARLSKAVVLNQYAAAGVEDPQLICVPTYGRMGAFEAGTTTQTASAATLTEEGQKRYAALQGFLGEEGFASSADVFGAGYEDMYPSMPDGEKQRMLVWNLDAGGWLMERVENEQSLPDGAPKTVGGIEESVRADIAQRVAPGKSYVVLVSLPGGEGQVARMLAIIDFMGTRGANFRKPANTVTAETVAAKAASERAHTQ